MATPTTVWRWRRSPLRRRIDVVEKWLILVAWLCAAAGGLLAGCIAGMTTADRLDEQRTGQRPVQAVVLKETPARAEALSSGRPPVRATVQWTGTNGAHHTSSTDVGVDVAVGSRTTVWIDGRGRLTASPLSMIQVAVDACGVGIAAATGTASAVLGGMWTVHRVLDRHRMRQWDRDWERADNRWHGRTA